MIRTLLVVAAICLPLVSAAINWIRIANGLPRGMSMLYQSLNFLPANDDCQMLLAPDPRNPTSLSQYAQWLSEETKYISKTQEGPVIVVGSDLNSLRRCTQWLSDGYSFIDDMTGTLLRGFFPLTEEEKSEGQSMVVLSDRQLLEYADQFDCMTRLHGTIGSSSTEVFDFAIPALPVLEDLPWAYTLQKYQELYRVNYLFSLYKVQARIQIVTKICEKLAEAHPGYDMSLLENNIEYWQALLNRKLSECDNGRPTRDPRNLLERNDLPPWTPSRHSDPSSVMPATRRMRWGGMAGDIAGPSHGSYAHGSPSNQHGVDSSFGGHGLGRPYNADPNINSAGPSGSDRMCNPGSPEGSPGGS
ncbi:hypothetical protein SeLEV6574_g03571 [Synchytrium endobioticum]|uniref:Uncharacterized protein n=1 Tax=Synchytrium endobioticum TaxID=286115 RepID=A0A507D348_9FUNG|nr:hypothetical protein SeLEV6574_g03571 [Synchytrium endobioticum]